MNNINLNPIQAEADHTTELLDGNNRNETMPGGYEAGNSSEDQVDADCGDMPFFMFEREDEATLMPLFKEVDSLIKDFAKRNPTFDAGRIKRYVGAHVCMEHLTEFIGKFKAPSLKCGKLSGWNMFQIQELKGLKMGTEAEQEAYDQRRKEVEAVWKTFSAAQKQVYKLQAEEQKAMAREARQYSSVNARYKHFKKHWKQFEKAANFMRTNYRTHLVIYRSTDTEDDKLYQTLNYNNSAEAQIASEKIEQRLKTKSSLGFLDRQVAKGGAYEKQSPIEVVAETIPSNNGSATVSTCHRPPHPLISDLLVPSFPATNLPATNLLATNLTATDLPATDLPATDLPVTDLPATDLATDLAPANLFPNLPPPILSPDLPFPILSSDLPPAALPSGTVPPATASLPPATASLPPATASLPPATASLPPATASLPPANDAAKRPRRVATILKGTDDEYESDESYRPDDSDSESERPRQRPRLQDSVGESSTTRELWPIAPLPNDFDTRNSDSILLAANLNNNGSITFVETASPRREKQRILQELKDLAKEAWNAATGSNVAPRWTSAFERRANGKGDVYGIVGWPEDIATPTTNSGKKGSKIDIHGLNKPSAKKILAGFRDGSIKFQKMN